MSYEKRPRCKCGKPCAWYGPHGGYSKACVDCNAHKAKLSRESRARMKVLNAITKDPMTL